MELNTVIWGDDTHQKAQTSAYSNTITVSDVIPDLYAWYDAYTIESNIDNSIALWQINDKSMFNRQLCLRRDNNGLLQKAFTSNVNAKSIWLCVPQTYNTNYNIHFNPTQSNCNLWNVDTTSNFYKSSTAQYRRSIITGFDYNRLQIRVKLTCCKYDSGTHVHDATTVTLSIYHYYHDSDGDSLPYKDNYAINRITIDVCGNNGTSTTNYIPIDKPIVNAYNNQPAKIFTNTKYNTPSPSDGYYESTYLYYAQNATGIGIPRTNITTIPQQAAFAANNSYIMDGFDPNVWELDEFTIGTTNYIATRFTGDYDEMLRQIAYFGFWFNEADTGNISINNVLGTGCTDDNVILPEIVGGRTTGNFKRGTAAGADPQATWGTSWRENVGYTGDKPYSDGDGDTGDLTSVFHRPTLSGSCIYYNMVTTQLKQLINAINSGYQPTDNDQFILDFKGVDPSEYISSILYYPDGFTCGNVENQVAIAVKIGALELTLTAYEADITNQNIVSFGTYSILPKYNDFRDYAPYTSLDLYIPFCGNVELDPSVFIGHTLQVYLFIDFPTGNCTGVVMRDSMIYDTISGSCGVSIPLTAQNVGSYQNAIKSAEIALKQAEIQRKTAWLSVAGSGLAVVGGAVSGNPLAVVGGVAGMLGAANGLERAELAVESAQYNLTHTAPANRSISAASPANAICMDYDCHLLIKRPVMTNGFDDAIYSHTVGNACAINAPLSSFSGYTVCADVDLSGISAPAEIKTAILNTLKSGVYI